jgi:asparagine synthase (glutamine-hydrolysing)
MCGIVGIFDTQAKRELDRGLLQKMNAVQMHRGPNEGSEHCEPGVLLGHRRLSIIDVAGGQQPIFNEDNSIVLVYNGEIYNFQGLVAELQSAGHTFRTHSDTEVIVHAWEQWGEKCVERFNGMFAFALWDRNRQSLFLARDRLGKKPLYYATLADGTLLFSSELKSLLCSPALDRTLDPRAVEEYFAYGYVPDPRTIIRGAQKLPPAHTFVWQRGQKAPKLRRYWDVSFAPPQSMSEQQVGAELIDRLREATRIRLMSEVPLGAFLSGGVDSSAIVALMAGLQKEPVNTCSIAFKEKQYDESRYAQEIATRYKTNHLTREVVTDDFDLLDKLATVYDEPFADSSAIPTYRVCELARSRVTVALSGDGGDECFGGYRRYKWHLHEEKIRGLLPLAIRRPLFGMLGAVYPKADWAPRVLRAKSTFESLARDALSGYFHSVSIISDEQRFALYSEDFKRSLDGYHAVDVMRGHAARAPRKDALSLIQYVDMHTYLPGDILVKVDRAAMAHSLEVRVPILDYTFVDWVSNLSADLKLRNSEGKYIFKKSLENYLPNDILYRSKMGFAVPLAAWFRGPLRQRVRESLSGGTIAASGLFDVKRVRQLIDQHQSGVRDHSSALWALLMFESAVRQNLSAR